MILSAIFLLFIISLQSMDAAITSSTSSNSTKTSSASTSTPKISTTISKSTKSSKKSSTTSRPKSSSTKKTSTSRSTSTTPKSTSKSTSTSKSSASSSTTPKSTLFSMTTRPTSPTIFSTKLSTSLSTSKSSTTSRTSTSSKSTSTSSPKTSTIQPRWSDPFVGGKYGNPGAEMHVSNKSLDQLHSFASDWIVGALKNMTVPELNVAVGSSTLIIKSPRILDAKFARFEKKMIPTNRISSRFFEGKIVADGEWQFKGANRRTSFLFGGTRAMNGKYQATITNGEIDSTNQIGRTSDAKPMIQTIDCRGNFSQFRIDIEGAGNLTMIENCDDLVCRKIRSHYEEFTCQIFRKFIKEIINRKLSTFPTIVETYSRNHKINYAMQMNEPRVTDFDIQAGIEGKFIWYGNSNVPFNPVQLDYVNRNRMSTFELSDYSFNTLFHQSHSQRFQYSAADLLQHSVSINDQLSLNCTTTKDGKTIIATKRKPRVYVGPDGTVKSPCMGSIFDHHTDSNIDPKYQFTSNDTGDMIYKSNQRAPSVIVQLKKGSYFDASNGFLEIYGPANGQNQNRPLLGRAEVRVLRGEFVPNFNGANITGSIKITNLELAKSATQSGTLNDLSKLTRFAQPLLTEMFNVFFDRYAQFPIPLLDGFNCTTPDFLINSRSMQIDCDMKFEGKSLIVI